MYEMMSFKMSRCVKDVLKMSRKMSLIANLKAFLLFVSVCTYRVPL